MKRRNLILLLAVLLLVVLAVVFLAGEAGVSSSTLSREAQGWWLARTWLQSRGAEVHLLEAPLEDAPVGGVLVLAMPLQRALTKDDWRSLDHHLRRGGTLLVAYSGRRADPAELGFVEAFDLARVELRQAVPYAPAEWWAYQREVWRLAPTEEWRGGPELAVRAFAMAPAAPVGARVLYRGGEKGAPVVFSWRRLGGRVVVLPAEILANGRLLEAGNGELLESLRSWLGPVWTFDEYHHGWVDPALVQERSHFAWDLFIAHLALVYLLALVALGRRFGPPWQEAPVVAGSTSGFLKNLGALHHKFGHHGEAARLLVERWSALHGGRVLADSGVFDEERIDKVSDGPRLLALARDLALASGGQERARPGPAGRRMRRMN